MRKIVLITYLDPESFMPKISIKQKNEDGEIVELYSATLQSKSKSKYTKEEMEKIDMVNSVLNEKGMDELTEEEIEYLLDPADMKKRLEEIEENMGNPENLQKLAGFRIEKKIVPLV